MTSDTVVASQLNFLEYRRDIIASRWNVARSRSGTPLRHFTAIGKSTASTQIYRQDGPNQWVDTVWLRAGIDNLLTSTVFGYFFGGGWAFGLTENNKYRITSQTYVDYQGRTTPGAFEVRYVDEDGRPWSTTIQLGAGQHPLHSDLTKVDQSAVAHDLAMRKSVEQYKIDIGNGMSEKEATEGLNGAQRLANIALLDDVDAITFVSLNPANFANPAEFQRAQLLQLQQIVAAKQWIGKGLRFAVNRGWAYNGPEGDLVAAVMGAGNAEPDEATMRRYIKEVFGGATEDEALARYEAAVASVNDYVFEAALVEGSDVFGAALGNVLADGDVAKGVVYSSLLGALGKRLATSLTGGAGTVEAAIGGASEDAMASFSQDFALRMRDASIGAVSSLLSLELGEALGLEGFGAELFTTVGQSVLGKAISNVVTPAGDASKIFDGFHFDNLAEGFGEEVFGQGGAGSLAVSAVASFLGAKLGSLVVAPQTQAGAALSSIGAAVGTWALTSSTVGIGTAIVGSTSGANAFLLGNVLLPGVGAFVGFVLGALIGNLFGKKKPPTPTASAETVLQAPRARYEVGAVTSNSTGNRDLVTTMAEASRDTLNGLIGMIAPDGAPYVSNLSGQFTDQIYGHIGNQIYVKIDGVRTDFNSADAAVDFGALNAIRNTQIVGGDIFAKRALIRSTADNLAALAGDIQTAADYRLYSENRSVIDSAIIQAYARLSAADESYYGAEKVLIDKIHTGGSTSLTTTEASTYSTNQIQIDRILKALEAQELANPWIITLKRVSELGLDRFASSDFYGGLGGLADSFGLNRFGLGYEALDATLSGADLTLSVGGAAAPDGVFSLLPQASADGRSLTIAGFLTSGLGYAAWGSGAEMAGNNIIDVSTAGAGQLLDAFAVVGGQTYFGGDDIAIGSAHNDTIHGRTGWDWLDGGAGSDLIHGGQDRDVLLGGNGADSLYGDLGDDYVSGGDGNDVAYGGAGADVLVGNNGADSMYGEDGDDTFVLAIPNGIDVDQIAGGSGSDTLSFERFDAPISMSLRTGSPGVTWTSIENLTGSRGGDSLEGDAASNTLRGLDGDDTLSGLNGDDVLEGGAGADLLAGGGGNDTASYENSKAGIFVDLTILKGFGGAAEGDKYSSIENVRGSRLSDVLKGGAGANLLEGLAGDDWIVATAGPDTYDGGDGEDFVDYSGATSGITLSLGGYTGAIFVNGSGTAGLAAGHTFVKVEGVVGSDYSDDISAGDGDQVLIGGKDDDLLAGGAGADTYVFNRGDGHDLIHEDATGWNTLRFGKDVLFQDLIVGTAGGVAGYLDVFIRDTGDSVRIAGNWANPNLPKLKALELAGGARLDLDQALNGVSSTDNDDLMAGVDGFGDMLFGNNGNDTMRARASGVEQISHVFVGGLGNDSMYGSTGDDSYGLDRAVGVDADYIDDAGGEDTVVFGPSVAAEDVIYEIVGGSIYIGARDLANSALTASQVSTKILINGGGTKYVNTLTGETSFGGGMVEFVTAGGATIDLRKLDLPWTVVEYTNYENVAPIILDLEGDGLDLSSIDETRVVAKTASGAISRVAWAGPTDAFLAVDRDGDGAINKLSEISFTQDKKGAKTDLEGLIAWDTNNDGVLDEKDKDFGKLLVWTDRNQNGRSTKSELRSLTEAGITSINLKGQATGYASSSTDESFVQNTLSYSTKDGKEGAAYDVALARRLINSEGLYAGAFQKSWGDLNEDGVLGRVTNDAKLDARTNGKSSDPKTGVKDKTLSYDQVVAAAKLDFDDHDHIDPAARKLWENKLDPAKSAEAKERQKLQPTDQGAIDALLSKPGGRGDKDKSTMAPTDMSDGATKVIGGEVAAFSATSGDDSITGTSGSDTLEGGLGNDTLAGAGAGDRYIYNTGDGQDQINEGNAAGSDRLVFGVGLNPADLLVARSTTDREDVTLSFVGIAGSVTLDEQFTTGQMGIENIEFGDGTLWTRTDLINAQVAQSLTAGNDTIYGFDGSNTYTITALAGDDQLIEGVRAADTDRLVFGAGLNASNLIVTRSTTDREDVKLSFTGYAGSLTLDGQFGDPTYRLGVEQIQFGDGTLWTRTDLINAQVAQSLTAGNDTIYGFDGSNTYTITALAGDDQLIEGLRAADTDRLVFGAGLNASNLIVTRSTTDREDVKLSFTGYAGSLTLDGQYGDPSRRLGVEEIQFGDGTLWTKTDLINAHVVQSLTPGNDTIYGFDGANTYTIAALAGDDQLIEGIRAADTDRLVLGAGLNSTNVVITRSTTDANDLTLSFTGYAGSLMLDEQLRSGTGKGYGIEEVQFGDGVIWTKANLHGQFSYSYSAGNDTITASGGADQLRGGAGDDRLAGGAGSDTYTYDPGDGADTIVETTAAADTDKLILSGVNSADILVTRTGNDLTVKFANYEGSVLIKNGAAGSGQGIETYQFEDGTAWSAAQMISAAQPEPLAAPSSSALDAEPDVGAGAPSSLDPAVAFTPVGGSQLTPAAMALEQQDAMAVGSDVNDQAMSTFVGAPSSGSSGSAPTRPLEPHTDLPLGPSATPAGWWRPSNATSSNVFAGPLADLMREMTQADASAAAHLPQTDDAGLANEQQLLRQAIAGFTDGAGGAPAVWLRGADGDHHATLAPTNRMRIDRHAATMMA